MEILEIGIQRVEPGLIGTCGGQDDAVGHGQPAVEIDHQSALHDCSSLNGLGLAVFAQHPLEHLEDADGRHHQVLLNFQRGQKTVCEGPIGEQLNPSGRVQQLSLLGHRRTGSRWRGFSP